jgi:hypothetical protein
VSQATVTIVDDFEGAVDRVICPEYDAQHRACRLKERARSGGPLSQLVERISEETLDSRSHACDIVIG